MSGIKTFLVRALQWAPVVLLLLIPLVASGDAPVWRQAIGAREWRFPKDNGAHRDYRTEWWYFTGNLSDSQGNRYGYELTFFREGIERRAAEQTNPWSLQDLYLAHFAVTDVSGRRFLADDRVSRAGPGLSGTQTDRLHAWLLDWSASDRGDGRFSLKARNGSMELSLDLEPLKPPVVHGEGGVSRKGEKPGQASYYASYTNLRTSGTLKTPRQPRGITVKGLSWFDHEFGSNQLEPNQAGWDWFSFHLSDGSEVMIYFLRRVDGSLEPASSGTIIGPSGQAKHLPLSQIKVEVLRRWQSTRSGAVYPSEWRVSMPAEGLVLEVRPLLSDQELLTPGTTGITYWEGAVEGRGTSRGRKVTCEGYVELTGYAGRLGGIF